MNPEILDSPVQSICSCGRGSRQIADRQGRREKDRFSNESLNDGLLSLPPSLARAILKSPHRLARGAKGSLVQGEPGAAQH